MAECPICQLSIAEEQQQDLWNCERCGEFWIAHPRHITLDLRFDRKQLDRSMVSHLIRRQYDNQHSLVLLNSEILDAYALQKRSPNPREQADNLILWVGDNQSSAGEPATSPLIALAARLGTKIDKGIETVRWLIEQVSKVQGFLWTPEIGYEALGAQLTLIGWQRYEELKHVQISSRKAFMAMRFNDEELNTVVRTCFEPAIEDAGFKLEIAGDGWGRD